jgi:hypothetical protein
MPSWVNRSTGLNLNVNYIAIHPATRGLSSARHVLLAATDGGIYITGNGGRQWGQVLLPDPTGGSGATIDTLTFHWVDFSPVNSNIILALGVKVSTNEQWIYKSTDALLTWTSRLVATS